MISEADIAEARRKALRNGEEDPVTIAQRYLNIYRQLHIFSDERKEAFDQSLLNLSPITISIISSLPGGLTFQDYIDEIFTNVGREKTARNDELDSINNASPMQQAEVQQPQILSNAQASVQAQQMPPQFAPQVLSGQASLSMGKDFAEELAKVMGGILEQQTNIQKESLEKVSENIGKTQLFIAQKLEDNKTQQHTELSNLCKIIAQSHTALSSSLATLGKNIVTKTSETNANREVQSRRSVEDDARLVNMINQSQEKLMMGLLSRLPQAVGVGNVNVSAPSRSIEDDARLAEMIAKSQENIISRLLDKVSSNTTQPQQDSKSVEMLISAMSSSQDKLISTLIEKLPQINNTVQSQRSAMDDERLVSMIVNSQENLIKSLVSKNIISPHVMPENRNDNVDYQYYPEETTDDHRTQQFNTVDTDIVYSPGNEPVYEETAQMEPVPVYEETPLKDIVEIEKEAEPVEAEKEVKKKKKKKKKKKNSQNSDVSTEITSDGLLAPIFDDKISDLNSNSIEDVGSRGDNELKSTLLEFDSIEKTFEGDVRPEELSNIDDVEQADKNSWSNFESGEKSDDKSNVDASLGWDFDGEIKQSGWSTDDGDSWGVTIVDEKPADENTNDEESEWVYVDEEGNEYLEDDTLVQQIQCNNDNQDWEWEYIEELDGNTCIYTSEVYSQKLAQEELSPIYRGQGINLSAVPQIYDESNEDEIGDPYKNSILKD